MPKHTRKSVDNSSTDTFHLLHILFGHTTAFVLSWWRQKVLFRRTNDRTLWAPMSLHRGSKGAITTVDTIHESVIRAWSSNSCRSLPQCKGFSCCDDEYESNGIKTKRDVAISKRAGVSFCGCCGIAYHRIRTNETMWNISLLEPMLLNIL